MDIDREISGINSRSSGQKLKLFRLVKAAEHYFKDARLNIWSRDQTFCAKMKDQLSYVITGDFKMPTAV